MKRLCFGFVLVMLAGGALAAWERIGAADDGIVVYADSATIQKSGDVVKMWSLLDYKTAEKDATGKPYLSAKLLQEYDCTGERGRTRYFSFHAGQMGAGAPRAYGRDAVDDRLREEVKRLIVAMN